MNSIKKELDSGYYISQIILLKNQAKETIFVVIEGEADRIFFESIFSEKIELIETHGKQILNEVIKSERIRDINTIAIRDLDYFSEKISNPRLFFYDYCCLEMMVISIDSCFERIFKRCNAKKIIKCNYRTFRKEVLSFLYFLSKLRKINEEKKLKINFRSINPGLYFSKSREDFITSIGIELKKTNSNKLHNIEKLYVEERKIEEDTTLENLLYITVFFRLKRRACPLENG